MDILLILSAVLFQLIIISIIGAFVIVAVGLITDGLNSEDDSSGFFYCGAATGFLIATALWYWVYYSAKVTDILISFVSG
jgi:ABC-type amino acid transport system permease subunit